MEELDKSVENQEVAELETTAPVEETAETPPEGEKIEAAPAEQPAPERDLERDASFASMRRAKEAAEAKAAEIEAKAAAVEREADRLTGLLKRFEFNGESRDDVADAAEAHLTGRPVEEIRRTRAEAAEIETLRREVKELRQAQFSRVFEEDIKAIKKKHPDLTAKTVDDLGAQFIGLRASGVDPLVAYEAIKSATEPVKKPLPPSMGTVKSEGTVERDYFTPEEIRAMSQEDIEANLDKVNRSQERKRGG